MKFIVTEVSQTLAMAAGAWLASHHVLGQGDMNSFVGSVVFLAGVAWSAWEKRALISAHL